MKYGMLSLISSGGHKITIEATDGKETIAKDKDVFVYKDSDFTSWGLDVPAEPTPEAEVAIYEMTKDGTYAQIFGGFGENLDRLCFTQAQVRAFCRDHRNLLRSDGWATFFLFKAHSEFFVASVDMLVVGLGVFVARFSDGCVWGAWRGPRVVVPQLALEP